MYLVFIGPHLQTRQLDHLCRGPSTHTEHDRRRCVHPRHLQTVTARVNAKRRVRRSRHPGADFWTDADDHGKARLFRSCSGPHGTGSQEPCPATGEPGTYTTQRRQRSLNLPEPKNSYDHFRALKSGAEHIAEAEAASDSTPPPDPAT